MRRVESVSYALCLTVMTPEMKRMLLEVEKNGVAFLKPIPLFGPTEDIFANLAPVDPKRVLRHFLPLHRFESLIANGALYLRRLDLFEGDPSEGKLPEANSSQTSKFTTALMQQLTMKTEDVESWKKYITGTHRKSIYVHSWFDAEVEDASMWRDYGANGTGICLKTNSGRLMRSLTPPVHLGLELRRITYIGEEEPIPEIIAMLPVGRKMKIPQFTREREIRVVATVTEEAWVAGRGTSNGAPPEFELVPVNLGVLLESITVGSNASEATVKKVKELIYPVLETEDIVRQSHMEVSKA